MKRSKLLMSAFHTAAATAAASARKMRKGDEALKPVAEGAQSRVSRNAACACGSGKKAKKCCHSARVPVEASVVAQAEEFIAVSKGLPQTVVAMLRAGVAEEEVYAYYHTGNYISDDNRAAKTAEELAIWDAHVAEFSNCGPELRKKILADISAASSSKGEAE
jgi:hypothetical protein